MKKQVAGWEQMGGAKEAEPQPPGRKDEKQCDFWKRSQEGEKLIGTGALKDQDGWGGEKGGVEGGRRDSR